MRKFLAAVARIVASMARTAGQWIKRGGRWIYEMLPSAGGGATPMPGDVHQAEAETPRGDEDALSCIRAAAASIAAGKVPSPEISGRFDSDAFGWLMSCDDEMLRKVVRAENAELRAHLQRRKRIRGVVAFDCEAIAQIERGKLEKLGGDPDADFDAAYAPPMAV